MDPLEWGHQQLELDQQLELALDEQKFIDNALARLGDLKDERERMKKRRRLEEMKEKNAHRIERIMEDKKRLEDAQQFKLRVVESATTNELPYTNK